MKVAILITEGILFSLFCYGCLKKDELLKDGKLNIKALIPKGWKQILYYIAVPLTLAAVILMLEQFYHADIIFISKRVCLTAILWPIAVSDCQSYRIPNFLVLFGLVCRVVILAAELFIFDDDLKIRLISEGLAAVFSCAVCLICMFIAKGSLGMGDLKLLVMMGILLGLEGICYSVFISVFFAFIAAIFLLVFKKKERKDVMPFAPFILAGTVTSIILSGV